MNGIHILKTMVNLLHLLGSTVFTENKGFKEQVYSGEIPFCKNTGLNIQFGFQYPYDRTWRDEDGSLYYGTDNEDGTTDWYNEDGGSEGRTDTPSDYDQSENDDRNDGYALICHCCGGTGYDPLDGGQCDICGGLGYIK